jgi:hypothetical protein
MLAHRRIPGRLPTAAALTTLAAIAASAVAGCGSKSGDLLPSSLSSLASQAQSAASGALAAVKNGVQANAAAQASGTSTDSAGRTETRVTVTNSTSDQHDYTVSVAFDDASGSLLDVSIVSVSAVPAHGSATATARSNRTLTGAVTAKVAVALQH